jgi:hypothetical protein
MMAAGRTRRRVSHNIAVAESDLAIPESDLAIPERDLGIAKRVSRAIAVLSVVIGPTPSVETKSQTAQASMECEPSPKGKASIKSNDPSTKGIAEISIADCKPTCEASAYCKPTCEASADCKPTREASADCKPTREASMAATCEASMAATCEASMADCRTACEAAAASESHCAHRHARRAEH